MNRMMIDLETLDTEPTAIVISVGYAIFDHKDIIDSGQWMLDLQSQKDDGRTLSLDTISWWVQQETNPIDDTLETQHYKDVLGYIISMWANYKVQEVWSCGSFDVDILNDMFDGEQPWTHFTTDQNFRSVRNWFKNLVPFENPDSKHDALADAIAQVKHLQKLYAKIQTNI